MAAAYEMDRKQGCRDNESGAVDPPRQTSK
jgi:hypothetical protein